jgi:hypothetical protein
MSTGISEKQQRNNRETSESRESEDLEPSRRNRAMFREVSHSMSAAAYVSIFQVIGAGSSIQYDSPAFRM